MRVLYIPLQGPHIPSFRHSVLRTRGFRVPKDKFVRLYSRIECKVERCGFWGLGFFWGFGFLGVFVFFFFFFLFFWGFGVLGFLG